MKRILVFLTFYLASCVFDHVEKIAVIKNESNREIVVMHDFYSNDDSSVFFGSKTYIKQNSAHDIFRNAIPDSDFTLLFFDAQVLRENIKKNKIAGTWKRAFLQSIRVPHDSLGNNRLIIFSL
jgi:hypothetical protein